MLLEMSSILPSTTKTTAETTDLEDNVEVVGSSIGMPSITRRCGRCGRLYHVLGGMALLCVLLVVLLWLAGWTNMRMRTTTKSAPRVDYFDAILHDNTTCQKTAIFPFRIACPKSCRRAVRADEPLYRMSMAWYFARPDQPPGVAYDHGVNYQCPTRLVDNFVAANASMAAAISSLSSGDSTTHRLNIGPQDRIHLSLSYLCCLRRNETDWAREVMYQWVLDNQPFDFGVDFEKVQCWHELQNSVTVILIANDATQRTMMKFNQDLKQKLLDRGIPTEIDRSQQMPFHITLAQVYRGTKLNLSGDEALLPRDDIRPDIPDIYKLVTNISNTYGTQWTGGQRMRVRHSPYFSFSGQLHAGRE